MLLFFILLFNSRFHILQKILDNFLYQHGGKQAEGLFFVSQEPLISGINKTHSTKPSMVQESIELIQPNPEGRGKPTKIKNFTYNESNTALMTDPFTSSGAGYSGIPQSGRLVLLCELFPCQQNKISI